MSTPREPLPPRPPVPGGPEYGDPGAPLDPRTERALWWERQMVVIGIGVFMLLVGGLLGYLIGHSAAKTRTVVAHAPARTQTTTAPASQSTTTVTTTTTATTPIKQTTVRTRTVTTPGRTVTAPTKTVAVSPPTRTVTVTTTSTITHTKTTGTATSTSSASSSTGPGGAQTFTGTSNQSLGSIHVASASTLKWSCPGCSASSFTITNSSSDPNALGVQSQASTSGQTNVAAGTYTAVAVQGTGPWTFTITPQG